MKMNGPRRKKIRTREKFPAMCKECTAILGPTPGFKGRTLLSSGVLK